MKFINFKQHNTDLSDLKIIKKALFDDQITQGKFVYKFEKALTKKYGSKHAIATNNGTSALILAIKCLDLNKGSQIITSPITFLSTATSILINGHKVVLCDIDKDTYNLDVTLVEQKLKKNNKIKAIIGVDYAGHPCDWNFLNYLKKKYDIFTINDNCHALGSKINNNSNYAAKYADLVTQSFHPTKHFTTGEGGAVLTNNKKLYQRLVELRNNGVIRKRKNQKKYGLWHYSVNHLSQNYRISDLNCALGISQIKKLNNSVQHRRRIAKLYEKKLKDQKDITIPIQKKNNFHSYHLFPIKINFKKFIINKKKFFQKMKEKKILLQVHYIPIYKHRIFKKYKFKILPNAENFYHSAVSLPINYNISLKQCNYIIDTLKKILVKKLPNAFFVIL